eukprot:TRINITY_DN551_c1_g1_i1.p1 TRINITY_DN551_c1_g1~~TRINITY_DN551_c1_g1_i1.p1  ORF type:complete len:566 (+),score=175.55 TRINITY_DN551_c1_g1_i1:75-1772(+)
MRAEALTQELGRPVTNPVRWQREPSQPRPPDVPQSLPAQKRPSGSLGAPVYRPPAVPQRHWPEAVSRFEERPSRPPQPAYPPPRYPQYPSGRPPPYVPPRPPSPPPAPYSDRRWPRRCTLCAAFVVVTAGVALLVRSVWPRLPLPFVPSPAPEPARPQLAMVDLLLRSGHPEALQQLAAAGVSTLRQLEAMTPRDALSIGVSPTAWAAIVGALLRPHDPKPLAAPWTPQPPQPPAASPAPPPPPSPPPPPPPSPPPPPLVCAPIGCRSPAEVDVLLQSRPCTTVSAHAFRRAVTLDADYAVVAGRETAFLAECTAAVAVPGVVCADVFQGSVVVALGSNSSTQLGTAASQIQRQGVSTTFGTMRATPATTPAPQRDCDDSAVWSWRYVSIALGVVVLVLAAVICALLVMRARSDKGGRKRRGDDKEGEMSRQAPSAATDQAKSVVYAPSPGSWPPPTSRPRQWQSVKSPISDRAPDLGQLVHLGPAWEVRRHVETCPALHDVQWTDVYEDHCNRTGTVVEVDTDGTAKVQFPDGAEVWYPFQCVVAAEQQPWHGEQPPHALTRHG